jgi:two-component system, NarL family, sensor histidine kinase BarA
MANRFLKSLLGSWSLERKCLLFLGLALLASLLLAFYAVQVLASQLVMETTRRSAKDYANAVIAWKHITTDFYPLAANQSLGSRAGEPARAQSNEGYMKILEILRPFMLPSRYEYEILRIDDLLEHESLSAPFAEGTDKELINRVHARLAELDSIEAEEAKRSQEKSESVSPDKIFTAGSPLDKSNPASNPAKASTEVIRPYAFEEARSSDSVYYYHPISFDKTCLRECHAALPTSAAVPTTASLNPFRVIKVKMPYSETALWSMWTYSILTSIAICTLALSLFFIHWVLKRLVIRPLSYMKHVSEEITRGDTKLRFSLETDDEFHELSESFNRMLRHMTETQEQLQLVNSEKDLRVDDLARVNLQLFEANRLKGEFLANMSHELRTPLNSILGFSEVLQGFESLTDKQRRYASNIQNSGRLLLDMINDILDLAKVEAGKMEVRPSEFCILSVIHAQCEIVMKMAEDKNIDLRVDSSQSEMRIRQDQGKVQQILTNLLSNAIKFTPEGGLVTVFCEWQNTDELLLSVSDTGVGVAASDYEIIFEKFRQAKGVTGSDGLTREHSGTGLGLSIVRELCRLLGGDISLSSQLGCGSTFRVVLPSVYRDPNSTESANTVI